jgi:hypothetical protein
MELEFPHASRLLPACIRAALLALGLTLALPAAAKLDLDDGGAILNLGDFNMRVSNAGILGNPFPERSFDPSFEYPKGSGRELMNYAALWVGGLDPQGRPRVSGDPLLEWRPSQAPGDTVQEAWHGRAGSRQAVDDDGDGRFDEEWLNGVDDDGDGEIDEDIALLGQQMLSADFSDDRPEAISYLYPGFERHQPLGLTVHQDVFTWSYPGYRGIAGLQYTITNHTSQILHDVYIGLFADFDVRDHPDLAGGTVDDVEEVPMDVAIPKGVSFISNGGEDFFEACVTRLRHRVSAVKDPNHPEIGMITLVPLEHSIDTLAFATGRPSLKRGEFRILRLSADRPPEAGGVPRLDAERYAAMAGQWESSPVTFRGDQKVLISCGPFPELLPGKSLKFSAALVVATDRDSLEFAMARAASAHEGRDLNLVPDDTGPRRNFYTTGRTGLNGHDACIEPPPGQTFVADPDCARVLLGAEPTVPLPQEYRPGSCIWTDTDCDKCTGLNGRETIVRWLDPHAVPPIPGQRVTAGDHAVRIEWDNLPEILVAAGQAGPEHGTFVGYNIYRISDWRDRGSLLPEQEKWAMIGSFGPTEEDGRRLLSTVTDSTLDYLRVWYEQPLFPIGRYSYVDHEARNGFDYAYVVTSVAEVRTTLPTHVSVDRFEGPIVARFTQRVSPHASASSAAGGVWVVPNPFRGRAEWDRSSVDGDAVTRHLDFMGLPQARCTIRIWTVAGDLVASLDHDGSGGDGQAAWNLVSRNGQEVASGIYVFTVESTLGQSTGRFVVIR